MEEYSRLNTSTTGGYSPQSAIRGPTLAGSVFAVEKTRFWQTGALATALDHDLDLLDFSFRWWACPGSGRESEPRIVTLPCSRVGLVTDTNESSAFRESSGKIAHLWLASQHRETFRTVSSCHRQAHDKLTIRRDLHLLNIRQNIMSNLKCRNFHWYLQTVAPEMALPPHDASVSGHVVAVKTNACLTNDNPRYVSLSRGCATNRFLPEYHFSIANGKFRYKNVCLDFGAGFLLTIENCATSRSDWQFEILNANVEGLITSTDDNGKKRCLCHVTNLNPPFEYQWMAQMVPCGAHGYEQYQTWAFRYYSDREVPCHEKLKNKEKEMDNIIHI